MENNDLLYQIALTKLNGIGPRKALQLIAKTENIRQIFELSLSKLHQLTGFSKDVLRNIQKDNALMIAEKELSFIEKKEISTHFIFDATYPRRLKQCADAPLLLFTQGNVNLNPEKTVAIVGTRNATEYGIRLCEDLVKSLHNCNVQIISGLAYGIDICSHQAALKHQIPTIGVLGHSLDRIYPSSHKNIAKQMLENGGLLSEFLSGTKPDRENFPMRNRIVAGMSDAVIVVESKNSGGSLITAELAFDYNKDVFAFPGNVNQVYSEGCNKLIQKNKAHLITSGQEFIDMMGWKISEKHKSSQFSLFQDLTEEELEMVEQLNGQIEHIDVLSMKMKKPVSAINVLLITMEIKGVVKSFPGNKYGLSA